jgi:hypothetical protein
VRVQLDKFARRGILYAPIRGSVAGVGVEVAATRSRSSKEPKRQADLDCWERRNNQLKTGSRKSEWRNSRQALLRRLLRCRTGLGLVMGRGIVVSSPSAGFAGFQPCESGAGIYREVIARGRSLRHSATTAAPKFFA